MLLCGLVLVAGLHGWIGGALTFVLFAIFRAIYGGLGCATPSATQAYLASQDPAQRPGRGAVGSVVVVRPGDDHRPGAGAVVRAAVRRAAGTVVRLRRDRRRWCSPPILLWLPNDRSAARSGAARR